MSLRGTGVRIIVHEPTTWDKGNLLGKIIFDRGGNKLIVKLSNTISGNQLTSDLIELSPHELGDTFKSLTQHYSVMIDGSLIDESREIKEPLIYGSITFD
ncbi:hypothetical protein [Lacihabitans soyangensis]|uniref:Uncharacterized protein n=1 Tax=Lacihabitans soyangensis TaxID=869394 RepID=A0AAE3KT68_9BACT|nr:hypothetical protein [Lacihabitans soyangensis]MCP9764077.1 hypothetical protein [Lacihabitans soyangensis]